MSIVTTAATQDFGEMSIQDYFALAKRRKFWIIFPALAIMIATAVMAWRLPNIYRCDAIILVEPQKVPASYFASTVTTGMAERISTIYQEVTSPARLKRLIDTMGLYPEIRKQESEQEAIRVMAKAINVEQVSAMGSQAAAFRISFKDKNPAQTAQVTNQITAMFIEENLKVREEQSYGTSDFIEGELQKTAQELQEKTNELADVRQRFGQDLPEAAQFTLQEVAALRQQLHSAEQQIAQDQQQQAELQSLQATTAPTVDLDLGSSLSPNESEAGDLQARLNALKKRYGPSHPDVKKLQAQVDQAKAKEAENPPPQSATPAVHKIHNPVIEAQLEQLDRDIERQKAVVAQAQGAINSRMGALQNVPAYQEKIGFVQRDYDALQARYRSLMEKKMAAETATSLENREKSERFVILDSAQIPDKPYSPNRPLMMIGGTLLGILVGLGVALGREVTDDCVRNEREAERILGTPVLSGVPEILTPQQLWQSTLKLGAVAATTFVVAVAAGIGLAHFTARLF
jgi:polysaccharide chain length determinant protein (PEP-CTERM system associated)